MVYNWGYKAAYGGGREGNINFVDNYYKPGPATQNTREFLAVSDDGTSRYYVAGNRVEGEPDITADNRLGVGGPNPEEAVVTDPFPFDPITTHPVEQLERVILAHVGCSFVRDRFDQDVIRQVKTGTAPWGENGIIDEPAQSGGLPVLRHRKPKPDLNRNGIPDAWEKKHGPDIEMYMNSVLNER